MTTFLLSINPQSAVENISNSGLIGSFFILFIAMIISVAVVFKKVMFKLFDKLNVERLEKDKEADKNRNEFVNYLTQKNDIMFEVIKNYSESNDKLRLVLERILTKL